MTSVKQFIYVFFIATLFWSCSSEPDTNFTLKGTIKGLKKGVVYLQKDGDSGVVNLDSMTIKGQPSFTLKTNIEEPILLYLKLFKNDNEEHFIPFFADKGLTELKTTLKDFNFDVEINGSKQQEVLDDYLKIMSKFNDQQLDLIQQTFLAQRDKDSITENKLKLQSDKLIKRKYAYTINFALNHNDSEVSPYLALYEMPNANTKYVDSVYNNLTEPIKNSFYGKKLREVLESKTVNP